MINGVVDHIAAQLNNGYCFGINFNGTKHTGEYHQKNQQNYHKNRRCGIDGIAKCDPNVAVHFVIEFKYAG